MGNLAYFSEKRLRDLGHSLIFRVHLNKIFSEMGINKPSWKIIGSIIFFIAAIITIATNIRFVLNCISFLGSIITKNLASHTVRDILLFISIIAILIWLIFINKKLKKPLRVDDGKYISEVEGLRDKTQELKKNIDDLWEGKYKPKEDEKLKFTAVHRYVLERIVEEKYEIGLDAVFKDLKKEFPDFPMLEYKCIVDDLIRLRLIRHTCNIKGEPHYQITKEGIDYFT